MTYLDHLILRVSSTRISMPFYRDVVGLEHAGFKAPFEILRVSESLTIDLLQASPKDLDHLAFSFSWIEFEALRKRLVKAGVRYGGGAFDRDGAAAMNDYGAKGSALSFYFHDPDGHNLEARCYAAGSPRNSP